jgi:anti-sigma B factor antagonist
MSATSSLVCEKDDVVVVSFQTAKIADTPIILQFEQELKAATQRAASGRKLLLNFSGVDFISSMMIGLIVRVRRDCSQAGIRLKLCSLSSNLSEAIRITGLRKLLDIYPDEAEAINAFALQAPGPDA